MIEMSGWGYSYLFGCFEAQCLRDVYCLNWFLTILQQLQNSFVRVQTLLFLLRLSTIILYHYPM